METLTKQLEVPIIGENSKTTDEFLMKADRVTIGRPPICMRLYTQELILVVFQCSKYRFNFL